MAASTIVTPIARDTRVVEHLYPLGRFAIGKLYNAPIDQIDRYEIAEMNLVSAYGLPGTEEMDMKAMLSLLDKWAEGVRVYTNDNIPFFRKREATFGSFAQFCITAMMRYLTREIGIRYNPDRITDRDNFDDPEDSFIHGLLGPRRTGTCASLPVLLVALGRRLGYPLKLVLAPGHCFCRWDGPDE